MPAGSSNSLSSGLGAALAAVTTVLDALPRPGMVIGGVAVILHGVPRVTRDVDATVAGSSVSLEALVARLATHGIAPRIADAVDFARTSQALLLRHTESGIDVDLSLAWLPFEMEAIAARERVVHKYASTAIARPDDLIIYKAVAWRPQDQQDIERLLTLHSERIDLSRVRRVVGELAEAMEEPERLTQLDALIERVR